jgi:hypothetical protein
MMEGMSHASHGSTRAELSINIRVFSDATVDDLPNISDIDYDYCRK